MMKRGNFMTVSWKHVLGLYLEKERSQSWLYFQKLPYISASGHKWSISTIWEVLFTKSCCISWVDLLSSIKCAAEPGHSQGNHVLFRDARVEESPPELLFAFGLGNKGKESFKFTCSECQNRKCQMWPSL